MSSFLSSFGLKGECTVTVIYIWKQLNILPLCLYSFYLIMLINTNDSRLSRPLATASTPISSRQLPVSVNRALGVGIIFKNTSHVHRPLTDDIWAYISMSVLSVLCNLAFRFMNNKNPSLLACSLSRCLFCPSLLSCVHLLIRLGHYIWGCWPNQCNKGSLRALLPISVIRLQLKGELCRLCLITAARRRWASISQVGPLICLLPYEPAGLVGVSHHTGAIRDLFCCCVA